MRLFAASVAFLAGVAVWSSVMEPLAAAPATYTIAINKMAFGPAPAGIHVGDRIEWVNEDIFLHSVTADDKSFDIDIAPAARTAIVVRNAGTIRYICKYHPGMKGQLIVAK